MSILDTTPKGTQAAILESVARAAHPRLALPTIASKYGLTVGGLNAIINKYGYPDLDRMRRAAVSLRVPADASPRPPASPDTAEPTGSALVNAKVSDLRPDPNNLREAIGGEELEGLADSIMANGLLQPIVVRRELDALIVVAGHRRLAAIKRLQWTDVDVIVRSPMRPDEVIAAMLIENGQRKDLDPIEEARGIKRLREAHKLTDAQVALKIGRAQGYVSGRLALLDLTPEQQDEIRAGQMGVTAGTQLGRQQAGKVRKSSKGSVTIAYFGETNALASRAKARCKRLQHTGRIAGGVACGACWESVIRADERQDAQTRNATRPDCVTCGHPIGPATAQ